MKPTVQLDEPLYTLGVAAEMLGSHSRTLVLYEEMGVATRAQTPPDRRLFTLRDVLGLRAVAGLARQYQMNVAGARQMIRCLQLLDAHHIPRPPEMRGFHLEYVSI
jgi:DNA-binding transcriptional MerR regulator